MHLQDKENILNPLFFSFSLFFVIYLTYWLYIPGINGVFIFDDLNNLNPIGKYKQLNFADNFWLFLLEGKSGPTGRPLSLASFYLNDTNWPSTPSGFIYTNILIHLLNGVLVFWFTFKLSTNLFLSTSQRKLVPFFATALWLLHPLHTTTVLYIIQRMTELSATFTLSGLIFYLYGREKLKHHLTTGFTLLFLGVGISLILSVLSKENGILLVAYILVVEYFLLRPHNNYPPKQFFYWFIPVVVIPFLFILTYLGSRAINTESFELRNFTLYERLLTESRIVFEYIYRILIPDMSSSSLFHDDFILSKNLLTPWTTLPSILGIVTLIGLAFYNRKKWPLFSFPIAWFFAGHIIESTVLPLELYFEHRNYLPMLGIFISLVWLLTKHFNKQKRLITTTIVTILMLFSFLTTQNAILWGKPYELAANWYQSHPNSQRTRELYLSMQQATGLTAQTEVIQQSNINTESLFIASSVLSDLARSCKANKVNLTSLQSTLNTLQNHTIHSSAAYGIADFIKYWQKGDCPNLSSEEIENFLNEIAALENTHKSKSFASPLHYWLSEVYRAKRDFNGTMINLDKAYHYQPDSALLKLRAAYLSSGGLYKEALEVLADTSLLETNLREKLALSIKQKNLDQLKDKIRENIKTNKMSSIRPH